MAHMTSSVVNMWATRIQLDRWPTTSSQVRTRIFKLIPAWFQPGPIDPYHQAVGRVMNPSDAACLVHKACCLQNALAELDGVVLLRRG